MELIERRVEVARLDALFVEEDALVVGLVEVPANRIGAAGILRRRVGHEIECAQKRLRSYRQHFSGVGQSGLRGGSLNLDFAQLLPDLHLRELIVSEQVEESVLFRLQFLELAADGRVQFGDAALFLA